MTKTGIGVEYLIRVRGTEKGPYPLAQVKGLISRKRLGRQHEVSTDHGLTWLRAGDDEDLFPDALHDDTKADGFNTAWHYAHGDQKLGPVPEDDIRLMLATGSINKDTLIWTDTLPDWTPLREVPAFAVTTAAIKQSLIQRPQRAALVSDLDEPRETLNLALFSPLFGFVAFTLLLVCIPLMMAAYPTKSFLPILMGLTPQFVMAACAVTGILCGHAGLRKIAIHGHRYEGSGMAIIGLIICYATLVLTVISNIVVITVVTASPFPLT